MRRRSYLWIALFFFVIGAPFATAADEAEASVDAIFAPYAVAGSPGCAVAVMRAGEIVYTKGYGLASIESNAAITPATVFHVASVSKQFTTFAVVLLAQDGKLSLEDDIREYLPELHDFGETITIRHLINHTSGLRDQWSLLTLAGWRMEDVITLDDIMGLLTRQRELNFGPGNRFLYCNSGYTLLGQIVERVSGLSLKDFCAERIFTPLGMARTHFHDDHRHIVPDRAFSYGVKGEGFERVILSYANVGATSLFTTVEDMARWDANFYTGRVGGMASVEAMYEPGRFRDGSPNNYGMGLSTGTYRGLKTIGHSGGDAGFRSYFLRFPEEEFSVVVLSNLGAMNPGLAAEQIADVYLKDRLAPMESPEAKTEASDPALRKALQRYEGIYTWPRGGWSWRVRAADDGLRIADIGASSARWVPAGDNAFALKGSDRETRLVFEEDRSGITGASFRSQMGWIAPLTKTASRDTSERYLSELSGEYYSEELDVRYRVQREGKKLVLGQWKLGDSPLTQNSRDTFSALTDFGTITILFTRDARGRVDAMRASTGRVKGLLFKKVD